jgi:DNA-directed RNA polymerase sigma subunit (sigma70/sigma32)
MKYDWRKGGFGPYAGMWIRSAVRNNRSRPWVTLDQVEIVDMSVEQGMEQAVVHEGLTRVLNLMDPRQSQVLRLRTGWEGRPRTRKTIATELGLTIAQVRHLEKQGLETARFHWEQAQAA